MNFRMSPGTNVYRALSVKFLFLFFKRVKRGLLCDVYTERRKDFNFGAGAYEAIFEYYFLSVSLMLQIETSVAVD